MQRRSRDPVAVRGYSTFDQRRRPKRRTCTNSTRLSSLDSFFGVYVVAGNAFGVMLSNVRLREFVTTTEATATVHDVSHAFRAKPDAARSHSGFGPSDAAASPPPADSQHCPSPTPDS